MAGINHDPKARKVDLFDLVVLHRPPTDQKNYVNNKIIKSHGHTPLRTPPYMCELNPIELAWAKVKYIIRSRNITGNFSLTTLKQITEEAILLISREDWQKFSQHVRGVEDKFWQTEEIMEEIELIIITLSASDDDTDDSDDDDDDISEEEDDFKN
ncbi:uncharacterized protein LOC126734256 [Anthonomus grandis grandis]|uniref:uncharacterized protein LOC126734256 n=1 Tax=Anthonomus grandis grandis TaxID=2921223 RepID=UPI00216663F0|nr:uncharacterized protein LOC126734256 [Anthonomus grandis grandis]